jgi:hypothetical protein
MRKDDNPKLRTLTPPTKANYIRLGEQLQNCEKSFKRGLRFFTKFYDNPADPLSPTMEHPLEPGKKKPELLKPKFCPIEPDVRFAAEPAAKKKTT